MEATSERAYTPCGGCGATNPADRCIGCFHVFFQGDWPEKYAQPTTGPEARPLVSDEAVEAVRDIKNKLYDELHEWLDTTGVIPPGSSYLYEFQAFIDDAVDRTASALVASPAPAVTEAVAADVQLRMAADGRFYDEDGGEWELSDATYAERTKDCQCAHCVERRATSPADDRLRDVVEALEPFAEAVERADVHADRMGFARSFDQYVTDWPFSFGDLRRAHAALVSLREREG